MRDEIVADAQKYGDERRSRLVEREAAQAIAETELVASEPVTVVLSRSGWVRAAKGHEIDPRTLSYKTGDEFLACARGRSTQLAVFLDSTGRAYSLPAHTLPSARGQGEPLSGRLDPPDGATFPGVLIGEPEDRWVVASVAGYGFVVKLDELHSRNRAGKAVLKVPEGATVVPPAPVPAAAERCSPPSIPTGGCSCSRSRTCRSCRAARATRSSACPPRKSLLGEETLLAIAVVAPGQTLRILSGGRHMGLCVPRTRRLSRRARATRRGPAARLAQGRRGRSDGLARQGARSRGLGPHRAAYITTFPGC